MIFNNLLCKTCIAKRDAYKDAVIGNGTYTDIHELRSGNLSATDGK
jgi:hypothetical protein